MLRNYITIAVRNLRRHSVYSAINISGLALGMACCILIGLFVGEELSYDRFHPNADRIYFIGDIDDFGRSMSTAYPLADVLSRQFPEVERATRSLYGGKGRIGVEGGLSGEADILPADSAFLSVFSATFLRGEPSRALARPNTMVISEEIARAYFGDENPIGRMLKMERYGEYEVEVTGVIESVPDNGYITYDCVLSLATLPSTARNAGTWLASMYQTFVLLRDGADESAFYSKLEMLPERIQRDESFFAVPLTGLYLSDLTDNDGFRGNARYLYIFSSIAAFILLIACINYVNLVTARSLSRSREVGVRKTMGAGRSQLTRQFLGESIVMSSAAFVVSLILVQITLPAFNDVFDTEISLSYARDLHFIFLLGCLAVIVGIIAGSYPAVFLSAIRPVQILKQRTPAGSGSAALRKALVVGQFMISVVLISGTFVIQKQLQYVQSKNLGFDKDQILVVTLADLGRQFEAVKDAFLQDPGVLSVSAASSVPGRFSMQTSLPPDPNQPDKLVQFYPARVDYDYLETLGVTLVEGRAFSEEHRSDISNALLINEAAAREFRSVLGWDTPIGKDVPWDGPPRTIIGVVRDFHFKSLHQEIEPVVLGMRLDDEARWPSYSLLIARLKSDDIAGTLRTLETRWRQFSDTPFEYQFLDEQFNAFYRTERRLSQVFSAFAFIAIFISCLGLLGLITHVAEQRTKEIGIRKVLGATASDIVRLLSMDSVKLMIVAFVVGTPVAYWLMDRWLENFAYRIEITAWIFILTGFVAIAASVATVGGRAMKAALANPADSLRWE